MTNLMLAIKKVFFLFIISLLFSQVVFSRESHLTVHMISTGYEDGPFFKEFIGIMHAAAGDLNIDLVVDHGNQNPLRIITIAKEIAKLDNPPDFVLLIGEKGATATAMHIVDNVGIASFLLNGGLSDEDFEKLRFGPQRLKHWAGQLLPDDVQAGNLLAQSLCNRAIARSDSEGYRPTMLALYGGRRSSASSDRERGLKQYLEINKECELLEGQHAEWKKELASAVSSNMFNRHGTVDAIWAANDEMALGAIEVAKSIKGSEQILPLVAGVDWLPSVLAPIENGLVTGSVGGQLFDGAWTLVLLKQIQQGKWKEFVNEKTAYYFADKSNLGDLRKLLDQSYWNEIEFDSFVGMPFNTSELSFGIELLIDDLE